MTSALLTAFLALMCSGLPVALAMAVASLLYVMISGNVPDFVVIHRMVSGIDSFPLLAVPFFIMAGNLMNSAGITNRIYNFALALVGWLKGGLGHVNVLGSVIFAGMSGTAIADAAGLGTIEIKAMKDHGYSTEFSVGVTAASATLGPIIPPSLPFRHLCDVRQRIGGPVVSRGHPARRGDGAAHDVHCRVFRAPQQVGARHRVQMVAHRQGAARALRGDCFSDCNLGGDPGRRQSRADLLRRDGATARRRSRVPFQCRAAHHDAGAADRRHDLRHLHRD
jgi:hypothetical protein